MLCTLLIVGCGSRGETYATYALKHPERARIVALVEPRLHVRNKLAHMFSLHHDALYADWRDVIALDKRVADAVVIALPDRQHVEAAVAFLAKGYNMLLEKPMATTLADCVRIRDTLEARAPTAAGVPINAVCHVLRYYAPCVKLKQLIDSGIIGQVVHINHVEPVGYWHFAHSFVRGNWRKEHDSSFSLLAKCCHDIDLIVYWMSGTKCKSVSSFGSLAHFKPECAPAGHASHCYKCPVESSCCYSAVRFYDRRNPDTWPAAVVLNAEGAAVVERDAARSAGSGYLAHCKTREDIEDFLDKMDTQEKRALLRRCLESESTTNYGRCVYDSPNDVCDNQVVNMHFENNATATLTMIAFSKDIGTRKTRVYGTKGQLEWDGSKDIQEIEHYDFLTEKSVMIPCPNDPVLETVGDPRIKLSGHGGSDYWLMHRFVEALLDNEPSLVLTDVEDSFRSHLIVFAAEHSRVNHKVVDIDDFCAQFNIKKV